MEWIFRNGWILMIAATCANAAAWWFRGRKEVRKHPELEEGYRTLVHRFLLYANLPWAVMGAGIMFGFVPTVFHYLNPRNGAFVTVWYITIAVLGVSTTHWIFLRDGAEALIRHPDC